MQTPHLAPIVLFVYNRPEHARRTVESLSENILASSSDLFIFSDAAKAYTYSDQVGEVRKYIDTLQSKRLFKTVTIEKAKHNKGLANSIIFGVSKVIKQYGKVIVVEDDLITAKDFLRFMNDALDYYKAGERI